ncbi:hypothetical protein BaRGS_00031404 [Batillaria attramentaria]|uniref:Uncharacterized protein n=1 Tax=Batillaria attramentaria TaxID=370345 RepID=A0ABD0JRT3_9CAEN
MANDNLTMRRFQTRAQSVEYNHPTSPSALISFIFQAKLALVFESAATLSGIPGCPARGTIDKYERAKRTLPL